MLGFFELSLKYIILIVKDNKKMKLHSLNDRRNCQFYKRFSLVDVREKYTISLIKRFF